MTLRIVVGVDLTESSSRALREAIRYASKIEDDELHPVYVMTEGANPKTAPDVLAEQIEMNRARLRNEVIRHCEDVREDWDQKIVFHVRMGAPADAIHQVAIDMEADLIVVGTKRRTGLEKAFMGSVAERVMRVAQLPVLVVHENRVKTLTKSDWPEPAQPGEELQGERAPRLEHLRFAGRRTSHISGLL